MRSKFAFAINGRLSSLLLLSHLNTNAATSVLHDAAASISNPLVDYKQCSHGDEEWRICLDSESVASYFCPAVPTVDFSQMMDGLADEGSYPHVANITTDCFTCSSINTDCETFLDSFLQIKNISKDTTLGDLNGWDDDGNYYDYDDDWSLRTVFDELIPYCQEMCEGGRDTEECSLDDPCTPGEYFCDYNSDNDFALNISGTCRACPSDLDECYEYGFATSNQGKINCHLCRMYCKNAMGKSTVTINGEEFYAYSDLVHTQNSFQNVSGPLVDCSNLLLVNEFDCPRAKGRVCFFDALSVDGISDAERRNAWDIYQVSMRNGCIAMVAYEFWLIFEKGDALTIPVVEIYEEENYTLEIVLGDVAQVQTKVLGTYCFAEDSITDCNNRGLGCGDNEFCKFNYVRVDGKYTEGNCNECPVFENGGPNPAGCFFAQDNDFHGWIYNPESIKSCAVSCDASLASGDCKFCPVEVSVLDFGVEDKADQCYFCPNKDMHFPDRDVSLFGENVTCEMVQGFFNEMEVHKNSQNCRLAQSVNYICGCEGIGYGGANTVAKQVVLVWLPRVSGILSMMLLSPLSFTDLFGSFAYALTTLPTPTDDYLYGSQGNDNTCVAQGFFIQVGTIACFLNVSLAIYYHLTVANNWTDAKIRRTYLAHVLFIVPIVIGLAFAFAGIPYFDNVVVWCNNSAKWWPEIPVIIAIMLATAIMCSLCYKVYQTEVKSLQYTGGETRISAMLFKQSCWFVIVFYFTWVPYLTLQYMLSSGNGYDNYGLLLSAATMVPLQGFWNSFVYIRPRYLMRIVSKFTAAVTHVASLLRSSSSLVRSSSNDVSPPPSTE